MRSRYDQLYGSGKTLTNAWNALRLALRYPGSRGLCGAETGPQLKETLQAEIPELTVLELMGRTRHQIGTRQLFGSCNPDSPGHYLYDWFVDPATRKKGFGFISSNYASNPYLPPDYIESLFSTYPENIVKRYLLGQWIGVDGLVYATFDVHSHVISPLPPSKVFPRERWAAIDFGGTDPHCILWGFEDLQGDIYITDEYYLAEVSLGEVARALHANPVNRIYCDHDVADRLTLSRDYNIHGLVRAHKERMNGIDTVLQALAKRPETNRPRLFIFRNCKNLIRELGTYAWAHMDEKGVSDHGVDTLRYFLHSKYHGAWRSGSYLKRAAS